MTPPSILLFTHLFPCPADSRKGVFMLNRARALAECGCDVRVISPVPWLPFLLRNRARFQKYSFAETEKVYDSLKVWYSRYIRPPGKGFRAVEGRSMFLSSQRKVRELHKERPFDYVLGGMLTNDGFAVAKIGEELGVPSYCHAIGSDIHTFPRESSMVRRQTFKILSRLDGVISVGENFAEQLSSDFQNAAKKIIVNPLGIDTQLFSPGDRETVRKELGFKEDTTIALYVGRLTVEKGIQTLIDAIPLLHTERVFFAFVGDGDLRDELSSLIRSNAHYSRCKILSGVERRDLIRLYQAADFFVFPSHMEGSPTVMIEAASCGLPIVASDIGPNHDVLTEDRNGFFFITNQPESLADAIRKMLHSGLGCGMGRASREIAVSMFDSRLNARALVDSEFH